MDVNYRLYNLFEDEAHCLDYQTVTSGAAQHAIEQYALRINIKKTLHIKGGED